MIHSDSDRALFDIKGLLTGIPLGKKQITSMLTAIALFLVILNVPIPGLTYGGRAALAILVMSLILWTSEAIPMTATCFLMVVLSVGLGITKWPVMMANFGSSPFAFVLSLLVVAMGMSKTTFAERMTYWFIAVIGTSPSRLLLAIVTTVVVLSAFLADIPCVAIMLPICLGILKAMGEEPGK